MRKQHLLPLCGVVAAPAFFCQPRTHQSPSLAWLKRAHTPHAQAHTSCAAQDGLMRSDARL